MFFFTILVKSFPSSTHSTYYFEKYFNLTTIQVNIHLSTDEPLINTSLSTMNTTTKTGNTLVISVSLVGIIVLIGITVTVTILVKRRKKKV